MGGRLLAVVLLVAQSYATPAPRTTSIPQLHDIARTRLVAERFHLGIDDENHGRWAQAAAEFEGVLAMHVAEPQNSTADYDAAIAYAHLQQYEKAEAALKTALAADPGFLAAMANLVAVQLTMNDVRSARETADRFVQAAPDSARALYSRGLIALRQNDLDTARNDFSRLLQNDPQYAVAHYDLGVTEARDGRWNAAEREFSLALDLSPSYARARFALGTVLLREGRRSEARDAFDRVAREPNGDVGLQNLAQQMRDAIHAPP